MSTQARSWMWIIGCLLGGIIVSSVASACNPKPVPSGFIAMPDVIGVEVKGSIDHLESLGLEVTIDESNHRRQHMMSNDFVVVEQDPQPTSELAHGDTVQLTAVVFEEFFSSDEPAPLTTTSTVTTTTVPATSTTSTTTTVPPPETTTTTAPPPPPPTTAPAPSQSLGGTVRYKNCTEARAAGVTPIYEGQPGYAPHLDGDRDGVACE